MSATESSYKMSYAGEAGSDGVVSMTLDWDLPFQTRVTCIDLENDEPCDNYEHDVTIEFNGKPVGNNLKLRGCSKLGGQRVSEVNTIFNLKLKMTGFQKGKRVRGRAEIFHENSDTIRRVSNTITVPYAASADAGGRLEFEASWKFPVEVTVTQIALGSRTPLGPRLYKGTVELTGDGDRDVKELGFQGLMNVATTRLEVKGRQFHMKVVAAGFERDAKVEGVVLVGFDS